MNKYQHNYSKRGRSLHDRKIRRQKANKTIAVLEDYIGDLKALSALDIGCSTGLMTELYAEKFKKIIGIDIDKPAIEFAIQNSLQTNLEFYVKDAMNTRFEDESFDVVICTHTYEHVPDSLKLMAEIYRVLKFQGVCYFAAGNRLRLIEPHYKLPLLSVIPKSFAHIYLRLFRKGDFYYENHLTLWGLRKLVSQFTIIDYTPKIIRNPEKFYVTEMLRSGSIYQKLSLAFLRIAFWISPSYIWLLQKQQQWEDNKQNDRRTY